MSKSTFEQVVFVLKLLKFTVLLVIRGLVIMFFLQLLVFDVEIVHETFDLDALFNLPPETVKVLTGTHHRLPSFDLLRESEATVRGVDPLD